jgi:hypothetical protein
VAAAGQLGQDRDGEQHGQRVAHPAPGARVRHLHELLINRPDIEGDGPIAIDGRNGKRGKIHQTPFWRTFGGR